MRKALTTLVLLLLSSAIAFAQGTTGKLSGTVSGPDGVLPGATVVAKDDSTSREITVTTDSAGFYQFPQLEFGTYTIRISAPGFKTLVGTGQKVDTGRTASFDATLEIGDVAAEVVVTAGADVITTGSAQVSSTVSPQQIMSLPMITRSPLALTLLQAGTSSNGNTTINGMRTSMTNITRDGVNIQDTFIRSNATDFAPGRPSVDDTAEFTITTVNQEADQGYGTAQIRLVTPRGTQDFHGALFAYNRNNGFGANSFFNNRTPPNADGSQAAAAIKPSFRNRWQYGGKVSGPIWLPAFGEGGPRFWKDKAVFFFSYEGIKDPVSTAATRTILTPSAQTGAFRWQRTNSTSVTPFCPSQAIGSVCEIPNVLAFAVANGLAVPSAVDPLIQSRVLSQLPTQSNFTGGDGVTINGVFTPLNTAGYRLLRRSDQTRDQYASRFDVDVNQSNSFLFIYNYNKEINLRPDIDTTGFSAVPDGEQSSENKQYTGAYRRVFSSNIVNEFRGGLFQSEVPFYRLTPNQGFGLTLPLVSNPENNFRDQGRSTKSYNFQSNGDWIWSRHSFKFGGQLQFFDVTPYNDAGIIPTVTVGTASASTPVFTTALFNSVGGISTAQLGTANGMLGLFGGIVNATQQTFTVPDISQGFQPVRIREPYKHGAHSLYFADRWQVHNNLTLSLGVRWEYYPPLVIDSGVALEPLIDDLDNPLPSLLRTSGQYVPVGTNAGRENAYYKPQYDNFAPNLGFAWTPSFEGGLGKFLFGERSVIRGGYSHAFGNDSIITSIRNAANNNAGLAATAFGVSNQNGRLSNSGSYSFPSNPTFIAPPRSYLQNNTAQFGPFFGTVSGIDPNIEVSRVKQYSFGIQREFWGNTAFEVRYVGTSSNNLVRTIDYNQIDIRDNGFAADFNRAAANYALTGNAFCTTAGCQPLSIFVNTNTPGAGRLVVGTGGLALNSFINALTGGTPADLAQTFITSNLNNHPTVANPSLVPYVRILANPASGVVNLLQNGADFEYNSLQAEVRRRLSNGLYFQANYTFSKNLGNASQGNGSQTLVEPFLDNRQPELDRTRVDFDQTHAFNFNGIYQLPFGTGRAFGSSWNSVLNSLLGGWELSGIVQWNSGAPITFVDPRGTLNRAGRSARQTANTSLTTPQIRDLLGYFEQNGRIYWINPSIICSNGAATAGVGQAPCAGQVFFNVPAGQTGTMGRAVINAPMFFNVDASMMKNFRFTENTRLQFRVEAYNVLNRPNFFPGATIQNINSTSFGQITTASAARQLQLALRFEF